MVRISGSHVGGCGFDAARIVVETLVAETLVDAARLTDAALAGLDLVQEVTRAELALQDRGDRRVQQPLRLARDARRHTETQHVDERRALQMAQDLQCVAADRSRPERGVSTVRAEDAARHRRVGIAIGFDQRAAFQAADQLRPKSHGVEKMELEPAGHDLVRHTLRRGVERVQRLREQHERGMRIAALLAESVRELNDVPGRGRGVQVVAQAKVRLLERRLGHDVPGPADRQDEMDVAEGLEPAADARPRATNALRHDPQLAEARGEHGEHPIRLAEVHRAQDDRLGLVETGARAHRSGYPSRVDIRSEFNDLLADIEAEMQSVLDERRGSHTEPLYAQLAYHLGIDRTGGSRGKRLRPLLGLLAYASLTGDYHGALPGAAAVELGHNFSLVHDDIEDADRERHHRPTLWAIWGVPLAINAGDALFALSRLALYRLLGDFSERKVLALMRVYDETCLALCEGQFLDISFERQPDVTVPQYLEMIGKKTAALIGASVQAGAILATDDQATVEAYRRFGWNLGLAFQMADDVKGAFWSSAESGKPEAGDVRKRKKTLPVVWAMEHADRTDAARLRALYGPSMVATDGMRPPDDAPLDDAGVREVLEILDRCGARDHVLGEAHRHRDAALGDIETLPLDEQRRAQLRALVAAVIAP